MALSRHPIGYRKNGQPIYLAAGGDRSATADQTRRTELLAILANPPADTDLDAITAEAEEVSTRIAASNELATRASAARARLLGNAPAAAAPAEVTPDQRSAAGDQPPAGQAPVLSPGRAFVESESFLQFRSRGATGTAQIMLPGSLGTRAVIDNTATSGGAFQNPPHAADIPQAFRDRMPRLVDLLDRRTTENNTVEYVQDTTAIGGGVAAETAEGGLKPESTFTFVVVSEPVRTVAHWVNLTRQSVDDNSMLQGYVEGRLTYGLDFRIDNQILNGTGVSPNLKGILNVTGLGAYVAPLNEQAIISIRKAITVGQQSEYAPDTCVMSPAAWQRVELSVSSGSGEFRLTPTQQALSPRIWGLTVVPTTAIADLTFLVGAFLMGCTLWERAGTVLLMTDSHASNFTSNIITLLAERRAALAVWRPKAFVKGTFDSAGN